MCSLYLCGHFVSFGTWLTHPTTYFKHFLSIFVCVCVLTLLVTTLIQLDGVYIEPIILSIDHH